MGFFEADRKAVEVWFGVSRGLTLLSRREEAALNFSVVRYVGNFGRKSFFGAELRGGVLTPFFVAFKKSGELG